MKISSNQAFYVVLDPTPYSTLGDICFDTTMNRLQNYMVGSAIGTTREQPSDRNLTIYTDADAALADARERLARRAA